MSGASAGGGASSLMRSGPDGESSADRPRRLVQIDRAGDRIAHRANAGHVERDAVAREQRSEPERRALLLHGRRRETEWERAPPRAGAELDGALSEARAEHVGA